MPIWVPITLLCALSLAASDTVLKKAMQEGANEFLSAWSRLGIAAIPLMALALIFERPEIKPGFYLALAIGIPFEVLATFLYTRAIRVSPMSLTLPFLAFTPVFVIITGFIFLGEVVTISGIAGILLLALGSYALNFKDTKDGILGPFKAIRHERGSWMMLVVSILYSITGSMIKVGINNSSPLFYGAVYFVIFSFAYAPIGLRNIRTTSSHVMQGKRIPWMLLIAGGLMFISLVTHMVSVSMTEVAYMVSVKRSSLLFGVLMGYMFFKETNIRQRFLGTFLMLLGFILIVQSAS